MCVIDSACVCAPATKHVSVLFQNSGDIRNTQMIRIVLLSGPLPVVGVTQYDHDYIVLSRIMDLPLKQTLAYHQSYM